MLRVKKLRNIGQIKGSGLNECIRRTARDWYIAELSNLEPTGLRADTDGVNAWCETLIQRFKKPIGIALNRLMTEKYTMKDARSRREPASYVRAIVRHAKGANMIEMLNQSYNHSCCIVASIDDVHWIEPVGKAVDYNDAARPILQLESQFAVIYQANTKAGLMGIGKYSLLQTASLTKEKMCPFTCVHEWRTALVHRTWTHRRPWHPRLWLSRWRRNCKWPPNYGHSATGNFAEYLGICHKGFDSSAWS